MTLSFLKLIMFSALLFTVFFVVSGAPRKRETKSSLAETPLKNCPLHPSVQLPSEDPINNLLICNSSLKLYHIKLLCDVALKTYNNITTCENMQTGVNPDEIIKIDLKKDRPVGKLCMDFANISLKEASPERNMLLKLTDTATCSAFCFSNSTMPICEFILWALSVENNLYDSPKVKDKSILFKNNKTAFVEKTENTIVVAASDNAENAATGNNLETTAASNNLESLVAGDNLETKETTVAEKHLDMSSTRSKENEDEGAVTKTEEHPSDLPPNQNKENKDLTSNTIPDVRVNNKNKSVADKKEGDSDSSMSSNPNVPQEDTQVDSNTKTSSSNGHTTISKKTEDLSDQTNVNNPTSKVLHNSDDSSGKTSSATANDNTSANKELGSQVIPVDKESVQQTGPDKSITTYKTDDPSDISHSGTVGGQTSIIKQAVNTIENDITSKDTDTTERKSLDIDGETNSEKIKESAVGEEADDLPIPDDQNAAGLQNSDTDNDYSDYGDDSSIGQPPVKQNKEKNVQDIKDKSTNEEQTKERKGGEDDKAGKLSESTRTSEHNVEEDGIPPQPRSQSGLKEPEDGHFFFYFLSLMVVCIVGYLVFHNKQKIIALIIEGRHERRRRPQSGNYKRLDTKEGGKSGALPIF